MKKQLAAIIAAIILLLTTHGATALNIREKDTAGTEHPTEGLTDKQLAIQRWFAEMTYLNKGPDKWDGWYYDPRQLGNNSVRYSLTFLGSAAAAMQYKTPAYREVNINILRDTIDKFLDIKTWKYIETYWSKEPTFPDPVAYENVMYSGYLAQVIVLYESISGDTRYDKKGFDFVWNDKTRIHYTTRKLLEALYKQADSDPRGGIPCEPGTIFIICNDYPHNAFRLYDSMHGTKFTALDEKWRKWMQAEGPLPPVKGKGYMKISYRRIENTWTTGFGVPAADGWALAWMKTWNPDVSFFEKGCVQMSNYSQWKDDGDGSYIRADSIAKQAFDVNDAMSTSFYPLVERQCSTPGLNKTHRVYSWFESRFGTALDLDGDGATDAYYYNSGKKDKVWNTANLALSMVTKGDSLKKMFASSFHKAHASEPFLSHVPYPNVMVQAAWYSPASKTLNFTLRRGAAKYKTVTLTCGNIKSKPRSITLNGKSIKPVSLKNGTLTITAPVTDRDVYVIKL